ncbi:peptide chain release factor N(5)-glutamine methyltransferase [Patescibacteria group bacterium]
MTIMEAIRWGNEKLKDHIDLIGHKKQRIDSSMLDAEILLAQALEVQKTWLFSNLNQPLLENQKAKFESLIKRRLSHEPIAYIAGHKDFYKRRFKVTPDVLIPRPATETLIEAALHVGELNDPELTLFADIGTGSGAIAVTLAAESNIPVLATDLSNQALDIAKHNATKHNVADKIDFRPGDTLEPLINIFKKISTSAYPVKHLILCANLPYLTDYQLDTAQDEVRQYEPHLALGAGHDGLDLYWKLFRQLIRNRTILPKHVTTLIEIDPSQNERIITLIRHDFHQANPKVIKDLEGHDRIVISKI